MSIGGLGIMGNVRCLAILPNRQSSLHQIPGSTHNENDTSLDQSDGLAKIDRFEARASHKVNKMKLKQADNKP